MEGVLWVLDGRSQWAGKCKPCEPLSPMAVTKTDTETKVDSVTCDGPSCHFSVMSELGVCLKPAEMRPNSSYPRQCSYGLRCLPLAETVQEYSY